MCTCASCTYTDSFQSKGFGAWPKGQPKGPRKASAEYAAHVRHCMGTTDRLIPPSLLKFKPGFQPDYRDVPGVNYPVVPLPEKYREILQRGPIVECPNETDTLTH